MARFASEEVKAELIKVANQLIENGKGLLAADEGHPVVGARLEKVTELYYWRVHMQGDLTWKLLDIAYIISYDSYGFPEIFVFRLV